MKKTSLLLLSLILADCTPSFHPRFFSESHISASDSNDALLTIHVLDVGQGDATLIVGPTGRVLLIDAGPPESGFQKIIPFLERESMTHIDWILTTHYDADHIGGIPELLKGRDGTLNTDDDWIPVRGVLDRGEFTKKDTPIYENYVEATESYREEVETGFFLELGSDAHAEVIVVNGHYQNGEMIHLNEDEENESSIGLLIRYDDFTYFTAGDLSGGGSPGGFETKNLETLAGELIGDIDILHVGHHGSLSSTNEAFLSLVQPEAALISVGRDNDYGHPHPEVLRRLETVGADIYRTDMMGNLKIVTDGKTFEIEP